jgi:2,4-dienoyl-CoA reductase-like NADH-dependent reductase (Old Yellow Enzyme family)
MATLFTPFALRSVTLPNRIMISPMCQYSAHEGFANEWHTAYITKVSQGRPGCVMVEVSVVEKRGRGTYGDLGIWEDGHIAGMRALATIIESYGAVPAIQIGHAGRKVSAQRPWEGNGPLGPRDARERGELPWVGVGASSLPVDERWVPPREATEADLDTMVEAFRHGARRAVQAGFKLVELHMAHGYLLNSFLSPIANQRTDAYGGSLENRMRFPLRVSQAVREALGAELPMSVRLSAVDGLEGGWTIEDSIAFSHKLKALGVDIIDCSSGGIAGPATAARVAVPRGPGYQVPFADAIRRAVNIPTIAVGLITEPAHAESILNEGKADIIAIGRQALQDPNWPLNAALALGVDPQFDRWPAQYGWWLARRAGIPPAAWPGNQ